MIGNPGLLRADHLRHQAKLQSIAHQAGLQPGREAADHLPRLAAISGNNTIRVWDLASRQQVRRLNGHKESVTSVAWSPDARRPARSSHDRTGNLWDRAT